MTNSDRTQAHGSRSFRIVTAGIGLFFTVLAIGMVVVTGFSVGAMIAAVIVGTLGIDAIVSACRGTRPLLSRIGPLP